MEPKPQISSFSADSGQNYVEKEGKCAFTPAQLHEFHQQSLILKYIVAGLPVPFYLIVPIWKSIARSFGSANGGVYNQYPSLIGFSPLRFDYRAIMDPEPGRCRRTDGKKWRCSKNVVPDQKYCERHMHRGRNRSRKHVEASLHISDSETALNSKNGTTKIDSSDSTKIKGDTSISVPLNLELATSTTTKSDMSISVPLNLVLATPSSNAIGSGGIAKNDNTNSETRNLKSVPVAINNTCSSINSECIDGKCASYNQFVNQVNNEDNLYSLNNFKSGSGGFMVQGFRFSPKSVLEGGYKSSLVYNSEETELHRCRRTDGKKWRCNKTIVPDQKYCIRHLHRGAKKMDISSQSVTVAVANAGPTPISSVQSPPLGIPKKENDHTNLDTNLSISIGARPQEMEADTSTSDATTITDENGSISHLLASSP